MATTDGQDRPPRLALEEWGRVAARSWETQAKLAQEALDRAVRLASSSRSSLPTLDPDALAAASEEYTDFVNRAVGLSLAYADDMVALLQQTGRRLLEDVQPVSTGHDASGSSASPVVLHGAVGSTLVTTVTLANHQLQAHDVSFEVGPLTGPRGAFMPTTRLVPAILTVDPGAEAQVELSLDLPADQFEPDEVYSGRIVVRGGDDAVLVLSVRTDPAVQE